jgi:hypothetical protein
MQVSTLVSLAQSQMGDGNVLAARWLFLLSQALWLPYFLLIPVWSLSARRSVAPSPSLRRTSS